MSAQSLLTSDQSVKLLRNRQGLPAMRRGEDQWPYRRRVGAVRVVEEGS